jgi:beta-lactamase regulating signal transducer with metallopeptidase domain
MIEAMMKSAIILAAAACIAAMMRRQSAAFRHAVWTAGLLGAMAIPLCTLALPAWSSRMAAPVAALVGRATGPLGVFRGAAIAVWLAGAGLGMFLLLYGTARLAWVAFCSEPVDDERWAALAEEVRQSLGIRRPVRLLKNRAVPFLGTWGIMAPRVLLPADAETWPDTRIRMVLGHELAHIQRHDWMVQVLADAARAIYWFNPIFWLASSRLRRESEHACDDAVVRMGATGTQYAEELLAMTRALRSESRVQSPILAMAQPSHLEQRLVALLNPGLNRLAATPWAVIVVTAAAIALTLPLAAVRSVDTARDTRVEPQSTSAIATSAAPETRPSASPTHSADAPAGTVEAVRPRALRSAIPKPELDASNSYGLPKSRFAIPTSSLPAAPPPPFECKVTSSVREIRPTMEKMSLGNGPWLINEDKTIWAADQPYVAGVAVNTTWMRPAGADLVITGRRLDGDAPELLVRPAAPYNTPYLGISLVFPIPGCWEVTATAGNSKLTFITRVRE